MVNINPYVLGVGIVQLGVAMDYELDSRCSISGRVKIFLFSISPRRALGPRSYPNMYHGVKRLRREADHSPSTSAEVKNAGAILPHHPPNTSS
jgi:hypothetical protein